MYITKFGFLSPTGVPAETFDDDSYTCLFPDDVLLSGYGAFWKKQNGEAYIDDWNDFQSDISKHRADFAPVLRLDGPPAHGRRPGSIIPPGSWNV
jgi:hypothetical protein